MPNNGFSYIGRPHKKKKILPLKIPYRFYYCLPKMPLMCSALSSVWRLANTNGIPHCYWVLPMGDWQSQYRLPFK